MGIHICTIAARNYLPFVRVLATSFKDVHPDGTVSVLIFDDSDGHVADTEPFEVLRLGDLGPDIAEFHRMAMIYDITEFATALKPWFLEMLLGRGAPSVLYLDPDIQVYSSLQALADLAKQHGIALTPHVDTPLPLDGMKTSDRTILAAGIYNLGFIGVGQASQPFLDFWKERLRRECLIDPEHMRFVDQRWVDFAPGIFDHVIVRDSRYNVAYWNLHGRSLRWKGNRYEVNGEPLAFFHFSGYSPQARHLLSKHQGDLPRILLSEHPELAQLCDEYAELLVANGVGTAEPPEYGFGHMADGTPIDDVIRHLYRHWIDRAEAPEVSGVPLPPDPFDPEQVDEFISMLNCPPSGVEGPGTLTVYLTSLHSMRTDLRAEFPDPQGKDHNRFMMWVRAEVLAGRLRAVLAQEPGATPGTPLGTRSSGADTVSNMTGNWAPGDRLQPGVVVAGYLKAELGIGEGARLTVRAVQASGLPHTTVGYQATSSRQEHPFSFSGTNDRDFDTNIVVVNADQFEHFVSEAGNGFFAGRYTIAQWAWELEQFPPRYLPALRLVNEVWAVSEFTRAAIASVTDKPVFAFPHPIVAPEVREGIDRSSLGLPDGHLFLFCFDHFSSLERKNPIGLIDAFRRAFEPGEGPTLVIKAINGAKCRIDRELLRRSAKDRPDIILLDRYLDHYENASLMSFADCYVSLHRSEGFGLTMAEAMALGKPVIATGYSGNLDYMDQSTSYLVPFAMTTVPLGSDPYPAGSRWADPDLDEAARLMRFVVEHPDQAAATGERARRSVLEHYGVERQARFVHERFHQIQKYRAAQIGATGLNRRNGVGVRQKLGVAKATLTGSRSLGWGGPATPTRSAVDAGRSEVHHDYLSHANSQVTDHHSLVMLHQRVDQLQQNFGRRQNELRRSVEEISRSVEATRRSVEEISRIVDATTRRLDGGGDVPVRLEVVQESVAALRSIPDLGDPPPFSMRDSDGREVIGYCTDTSHGVGYAAFEDVFRGSEELIRERLRVYLPLLVNLSSVLDVGCGRGELLDLLAEEGHPAEGIDLDPTMVDRSRVKGHTVEEGDAVELLQKRPPRSIGAIVSIQVVEHLSYESFLALLTEVHRVLEPGGLFIAETVNPHALQAFKAFWTDMTHQHPIFPEVLVTHCRDAGFGQAQVLFPGGSGVLDKDRWTCGDYAVIARVATDPPR